MTHPVVTVHPVSGNQSIFVNPQFTLYIKGMAEDESRMILEMLYRKTLIHEHQYQSHHRLVLPDLGVGSIAAAGDGGCATRQRQGWRLARAGSRYHGTERV